MEKSPYVSPISDKFQAKFNEFAKKRGLVDNKAIEAFAKKFYLVMLKNVKQSEHCPFPDSLAFYYKKAAMAEIEKV